MDEVHPQPLRPEERRDRSVAGTPRANRCLLTSVRLGSGVSADTRRAVEAFLNRPADAAPAAGPMASVRAPADAAARPTPVEPVPATRGVGWVMAAVSRVLGLRPLA